MTRSPIVIEVSLKTIWKVVLILLGVWFLFAIRDILLLLFLAIIISSAIQPIVDKLEKNRIPRVLSSLVIYIVTLTFFVLVIKIITPILGGELKELGAVLNTYITGIVTIFDNFVRVIGNWNIQEQVNNIKNNTSQFGFSLFSNTLGAFTGLFKTTVVLSLSFYMVVKEDGAWGFLKDIVPKKYANYSIDLIQRIQHQIGRWMIGQFILVIIIFVLEYVALSLLGVPMALTLALLGGLLEVIPYIGPTISVIPAFLIGLTISPLIAFVVILAYILIQQLENHIIVPLLMKKAVGLNPVIIILVLLIGGKLAGIGGLILAVPLTAAIGIIFDDLINNKVKF